MWLLRVCPSSTCAQVSACSFGFFVLFSSSFSAETGLAPRFAVGCGILASAAELGLA